MLEWIPLISSYSVWVRIGFVIWVVYTAIGVGVLVLAPHKTEDSSKKTIVTYQQVNQTIDNKGGIYNAEPNQGTQTINNYSPPERYITDEQLKKFIAVMPNGNGEKIAIRIQDGSNEGRRFAKKIEDLFQHSGWKVIHTDAANTLPDDYRDLIIEVGDPEPAIAKSIAHAFTLAEIKFQIVRGPWTKGIDALRIVIWPSS